MKKIFTILIVVIAPPIFFFCMPFNAMSKTHSSYYFEKEDGNIEFNFPPIKLDQGCDVEDLPFHFFRHPENSQSHDIPNPGIITSNDFIIWANAGFPQEKISPESYNAQKTIGLQLVKNKAKEGIKAYETILANYYLYFQHDTKKGLFWAKKAAEEGENGSMVILGDAYIEGNGLVQDRVEGLKWYILGSSLGNLAAQGRLLSESILYNGSIKEKNEMQQAFSESQKWQKNHKKKFISKA